MINYKVYYLTSLPIGSGGKLSVKFIFVQHYIVSLSLQLYSEAHCISVAYVSPPIFILQTIMHTKNSTTKRTVNILIFCLSYGRKKSLSLCICKMSLVMRKPAFCICENKDSDQLRGNREADQRLCFRYIASTIPLIPKYKISSFKPSSVTVQPGLCRTWSVTPKTGFLTTRLKLLLFA